jgi:hypothetical protein
MAIAEKTKTSTSATALPLSKESIAHSISFDAPYTNIADADESLSDVSAGTEPMASPLVIPVEVLSGGIAYIKVAHSGKVYLYVSDLGRDPPIIPPHEQPSAPLEEAYGLIGWWKGPDPLHEARVKGQVFWKQGGEKRIRWLTRRLRSERNIETLQGAASLLADCGPLVIGPILDELSLASVGDNGLALLGALSYLKPADGLPYKHRLHTTIQRYLKHDLLELREAAVKATAILPAASARDCLREALSREHHPVVRETLEDALADRQD